MESVVEEMMGLHRSLPSRPGMDEVEAARGLIGNLEKEEQSRLESISRHCNSKMSPHVPKELISVLFDMHKHLLLFNSKQHKSEALKLLDLDSLHQLFDDFIQRASNSISNPPNSTSIAAASSSSTTTTTTTAAASAAVVFPNSLSNKETAFNFTRDDTYLHMPKSTFYSDRPQILDSSLKSTISSGQDGEKLSLIKLASLIEISSKKGTTDLNLQSKLSDQVEWLPDSIGKLSSLLSLDLSENRILVLPDTIGGLSSLTKLDLHSNRIAQLPDAIGDLLCLLSLDLRANQLTSLPTTFARLARLEDLDLSSNNLSLLPDSIGSLVSLKKLNIETNDIEEIPHTIGHCSSLQELRADYNRLKAIPEAVGKIQSLEVLSVRYNNIKQLPTTMSSLLNLKELDVSFNELESVPESLCFATTLVKINVGNNFADLQSLPRSIGNLEMLEELDISNNQIRVLPDSFRMLSRLRVLRVEENPLEVPPRHIAEKGAQDVVQYMADLFAKKDVKLQPVKQKKSWANICFFSKSNKRKRNGIDYVKT